MGCPLRPGETGDGAAAVVTSYGWRIMNTGTGACRSTASATDPNSSRPSPVRPWVAIAIRSTSLSHAAA